MDNMKNIIMLSSWNIYTIFPGHEGNDTTVLKIMTIEQAHKRYGRI
jgi:hypothetical protein